MLQDKEFWLELVLHASDIGHTTRPFHITANWTSRITEEFFRQGDTERELGLPISFPCNRADIFVPTS